MPHDILNSMRALREDMRQRLLQVPEYRALVALDNSIDEICAILQDALAINAPAPPAAPQPQAALAPAIVPEAAPPRQSSIATAFAETLAAKIDQRNGVRAAAAYQPPNRAQVG